MDNDQGTPARDHQDGDAFDREGDEAVSDQQGETAPEGADEPGRGQRRGKARRDREDR